MDIKTDKDSFPIDIWISQNITAETQFVDSVIVLYTYAIRSCIKFRYFFYTGTYKIRLY